MKISHHIESWALARPFRIAGKTWLSFDCLVAEVLDGQGHVGRGEAMGVHYCGETLASMAAQIDALPAVTDRATLLQHLPPGGARNALDCALWDLEAKRSGRSVFELVGAQQPAKLQTVSTIGLEPEPEDMARRAVELGSYSLLKIKLDGDRPLERTQAIRAARPDARLVIDANQGWNFAQLQAVAPGMAALGVEMIEQPLPRGADEELEGWCSAVPLCADESCLHGGELDTAARRYQRINIKLDKTGGLTHALQLAARARERGLGLMVGCMGGSSLAMAPAFVLGSLAELIDIDGPLLQRHDRFPSLRYERGWVSPPTRQLWG